jgi:hypothetical protein
LELRKRAEEAAFCLTQLEPGDRLGELTRTKPLIENVADSGMQFLRTHRHTRQVFHEGTA